MFYFLLCFNLVCGACLGFSIAVLVIKPRRECSLGSSTYELSIPKQAGAVLHDSTSEEVSVMDMVGAKIEEEETGEIIDLAYE